MRPPGLQLRKRLLEQLIVVERPGFIDGQKHAEKYAEKRAREGSHGHVVGRASDALGHHARHEIDVSHEIAEHLRAQLGDPADQSQAFLLARPFRCRQPDRSRRRE